VSCDGITSGTEGTLHFGGEKGCTGWRIITGVVERARGGWGGGGGGEKGGGGGGGEGGGGGC